MTRWNQRLLDCRWPVTHYRPATCQHDFRSLTLQRYNASTTSVAALPRCIPAETSPPYQTQRNHGFTLIELMMVMVLIGIMTAMILPEMQGTYEEALLRSTARKLVKVFTLANSRAITLNQIQRVHLDPRQGRYAIENPRPSRHDENGSLAPRDVPGGRGELDSRITIEIRPPDEVPPVGAELGSPALSGDETFSRPPGESLAFYPDGTADAVEIVLRDRHGFQLSLRINPTTARVQVTELERK